MDKVTDVDPGVPVEPPMEGPKRNGVVTWLGMAIAVISTIIMPLLDDLTNALGDSVSAGSWLTVGKWVAVSLIGSKALQAIAVIVSERVGTGGLIVEPEPVPTDGGADEPAIGFPA